MKIIHCADLHLDSKLAAFGSRAAERRNELLGTFVKMADYAEKNSVKVILIAGDMFDVKNISRKTKNTVLDTIREHPDLHFYYLKGNHDKNNFLEGEEDIPDNLFLFGRSWTSYDEGDVCISAVELDAENAGSIYASLVLDPHRFNVVMLHGQEVQTGSGKTDIDIDIRRLSHKGIDYLALGHVHAYKRERLDGRGIYCYSGCLEGRGFDECGTHGFVLLDIDEASGTFTDRLIPFARRTIYEVTADVSGLQTSMQMREAVRRALDEAACTSEDMVNIILTGVADADAEKDIGLIQSLYDDDYDLVRVEDRTTLRVNEMDYIYDESLKGEFVRLVMADKDLSGTEKGTIIRYGLKALAGENL